MSKSDEQPIDVKLDSIYLATNLTIIRSTCLHYDIKNKFCRCCRFYSSQVQLTKYGEVCSVWESVFGKELRAYILSLVSKGIRINQKFVDVWNSRKVSTSVSTRQALVRTTTTPDKPQTITIIDMSHG